MTKKIYKITPKNGPGRTKLALSRALYHSFNALGLPHNRFSRLHMLHLTHSEGREDQTLPLRPGQLVLVSSKNETSELQQSGAVVDLYHTAPEDPAKYTRAEPYVFSNKRPNEGLLQISRAAYFIFNVLGLRQNHFTKLYSNYEALRVHLEKQKAIADGLLPDDSVVLKVSWDSEGKPTCERVRTVAVFEAGKGYTSYSIDPVTGERTVMSGVESNKQGNTPS